MSGIQVPVPSNALSEDEQDLIAFKIAQKAKAYAAATEKAPKPPSEQEQDLIAFGIAKKAAGYAAAVVALVAFVSGMFGWNAYSAFEKKLADHEKDMAKRQQEFQDKAAAYQQQLQGQIDDNQRLQTQLQQMLRDAQNSAHSVGMTLGGLKIQQEALVNSLVDARVQKAELGQSLSATQQHAAAAAQRAEEAKEAAKLVATTQANLDGVKTDLDQVKRRVYRSGSFVLREREATDLLGFPLKARFGVLRKGTDVRLLEVADRETGVVLSAFNDVRIPSLLCLPPRNKEVVRLTLRYGISNWPRKDIIGMDVQSVDVTSEAAKECPAVHSQVAASQAGR